MTDNYIYFLESDLAGAKKMCALIYLSENDNAKRY